jgi:ribonuclease HI
VEYLDDRDINVFTDGSSYSRPRRGGVGIRFITTDMDGAEHAEDYPLPGYEGATNQQMEIQACIEVLRAVVTRRAPIQRRQYRRLVVWTDSMYVVDGYTSALFNWQINGWLTSDGNPVANAAIWPDAPASRRSNSDGSRGTRRVPTTRRRTSSQSNQRADNLVAGPVWSRCAASAPSSPSRWVV